MVSYKIHNLKLVSKLTSSIQGLYHRKNYMLSNIWCFAKMTQELKSNAN